MNDDGGTPEEPVTSVLRAAEAFVSRLKNHDQIGVVTYATKADTVHVLTTDKSTIQNTIAALGIKPADERGSTNTGDAIIRATEEFNSERHNSDARKIFVLLTDGLANAPGEEPEQYARTAAQVLKDAGVDIYTIGLGTKVNQEFLSNVATDAEHMLTAPNAEAVDAIYRKVTSSICEDGPAVIEIIPKTETSFAPLQ
jgi:Mg-chelatase subunit ChlD